MLVSGILTFSVATFAITLLVGNADDSDRGKTAAYITLIAWSALLFGLYLGKTAL